MSNPFFVTGDDKTGGEAFEILILDLHTYIGR